MPEPTSPPRRYATGAWLDFTTVTLMVDAASLRAVLPSPRLDLAPIADAPPGRHPILLDLSRVRDGRPEPGGVDQHTWSEVMGAGYGAFAGAFFGPLGAAWGAAAGRMAGKQMSEVASRTIGTYNEAMAFVPNVALDGRGPHLLSLGMYTDSPVSKRLSEIFRSGFGKRMARIASRGFAFYDVASPGGARLLSAQLTPARFGPLADAPELRETIGWLSQPVLGHLGGGAFALAHVDRDYDDQGVRVAPVTGLLAIEHGFLPGVPQGAWEIGRDEGITAFQATYVPVKLDFPAAVGS